MQPAALQGSTYNRNAERSASAVRAYSDYTHHVLTLVVAAAIIVCDWYVELGVAIGVAYVIVIWMADATGSRRFVRALTIICTGLVIVGYLHSPSGGEEWKVLVNRGLSLLAIWMTAAFVLQRSRANELQQELNHKLQESNEALTQSNIDLQQFAYVASHDLQSPLRHISGFVQLLQEEYGEKLDGEARKWIGFTVDGVERMQALIRDLLTFSRVDSKSKPFVEVELNKIVDRAVEVLADDDATVTRDDLPAVNGDASQLMHLLQNLIGNGIKYHGDKPARVHVFAELAGDDWVISVRDDGIGIDPKHHQRVFEVFRRLHTAQEYPGTGIGLAVCRRIALRHGGRIWIDSEKGAGATFSFTLPKQKAMI